VKDPPELQAREAEIRLVMQARGGL
jgi:hypothetical protein